MARRSPARLVALTERTPQGSGFSSHRRSDGVEWKFTPSLLSRPPRIPGPGALVGKAWGGGSVDEELGPENREGVGEMPVASGNGPHVERTRRTAN